MPQTFSPQLCGHAACARIRKTAAWRTKTPQMIAPKGELRSSNPDRSVLDNSFSLPSGQSLATGYTTYRVRLRRDNEYDIIRDEMCVCFSQP
jgi:hypothetical protein